MDLTPIGSPAATQTKVQGNKDIFHYGRCWCQIPPEANGSRRKNKYVRFSDMQEQGGTSRVKQHGSQCHNRVRWAQARPLASSTELVIHVWQSERLGMKVTGTEVQDRDPETRSCFILIAATEERWLVNLAMMPAVQPANSYLSQLPY